MNINNIANNIKALVPVSYKTHGNAPISVLTNYQIYQVKSFLTIVTNFISQNGPINSTNIAYLYNQLSYSKPHQHLLSYLFPNLRVNVAELGRVYPDIRIHTQAQFINTTEGFSIIVFQALKHDFDHLNEFITKISLLPNVCGAYPRTLNDISFGFQNTKQENPDALVTLYNKDGNLLCKRYFDSKLGDAPGFHASVMVANDPHELLEKAGKLLNKQKNVLGQSKHLFIEHPCLLEAFNIITNTKFDVLTKLSLTQSIFKLNIHKLPANLVPSLLIDRSLPNKSEVLNFTVEREALKTYTSTENMVVTFIKKETSPNIAKNLADSEGFRSSLRALILENTPFFKALPKIPTDLTSIL